MSTTTYTTPETITDEQIETLRSEAAAAGDLLMVDICTIALVSGLADIAKIRPEHRADLEQLGIIPEHVDADVRARAECARVIAEAEAMIDDEPVDE